MLIKVREIINIKGWKDGSGWQYDQCYSDSIVDVPEEDLAPDSGMDWSWWESNELAQGEDVEVTVSYYPSDCEDLYDAEPIASWSCWESEMPHIKEELT